MSNTDNTTQSIKDLSEKVVRHTETILKNMKAGSRMRTADLEDTVAKELGVAKKNVSPFVKMCVKQSTDLVVVTKGRTGGIHRLGFVKNGDATVSSTVSEKATTVATNSVDIQDSDEENESAVSDDSSSDTE